ncbi:cerebellar degeneration-related protein 2 isoform X2 [Adelges cooleyi]|uniref:cerebellar degeneration-related protein 2 isoform X2 n=1 Tax=Adelges cooleyi TaxID=133065 RepID=UPI00217FE63B|nr:cerebellar degeneration-related protein 2 isoform X2 [Adelges cooleyi]
MDRHHNAGHSSELASLDCWDYTIELECLRGPQDLQLAAELGKTLLERNKELETSLRQQQNLVDDRNQEIEYLTKQTAALREVNDSRLRIYEQLEISIQDLERNNQRLVQENLTDKKHIKSLYETIESLESRCEDLQHLVDDMGHSKKDDSLVSESSAGGSSSADLIDDNHQDDLAKLTTQLEHAKSQRAKEQRKVTELEQNVSMLIQENTNLEERVSAMQQKDEELKVLQDQIVYLEEIRQGNLCRRCQRSADANLLDEYSVYDDDDDTDDISAIGSYVETHKNEVLQQLQETLGENYSADNPYRVLVDKYEALLKIQQKHNAFNGSRDQGISLHEELQMSGQFSSFNGNATDSEDDAAADPPAAGKQHVYSETETTSSSGFSDETSNKGTQTETFFTGSFLCTISDGDDCRFSIYDDASPIESRFRKTPEYRQLFREIFAVLKRAAEAKDEGERLPLLQDDPALLSGVQHDDDDDVVDESVPRVPPATPACEANPLISSIESAVAQAQRHHQQLQQQQQPQPKRKQQQPAAAAAAREHRRERRQKHQEQPHQVEQLLHQREPSETRSETAVEQPALRRRDIIEELALAAAKQKKQRHHHHRRSASKQQSKDISHLLEFKWTDHMTRRQGRRAGSGERSASGNRATWCASKDDVPSSSPARVAPEREAAATPYASAASQEVAKLKLLEKSYAEVLRLDRKKMSRPHSQYFNSKM